MTPAQAYVDQRRPWLGTALLGVVVVCLAAAFFLLEKQRIDERRKESVAFGKSVGGEIIAATFLTRAVTADDLEIIEQYPQIESLTFSNTQSVEGGLQRLQRFGRLKTLDVSRTEWLDAMVLKDIAALPHLRNLSFANSNVSDAALSRLAASRTLETLALNNCGGITDASIDTLQQIPTLREVWIEGTGLTLKGFRRLRTSRQDLVIECEIEQFLSVNLTTIFDEEPWQSLSTSAAADDLEILLELPHNWWSGRWGPALSLHDVRDLTIAGPSPVESMAILAPRIVELDRLSLPAAALAELEAAQVAPVKSVILTAVTPDDDLSNLRHMAPLEHLRLEVVSPLGASQLRELGELQHLDRIELSGPALSTPLIASVVQIPTLRSLLLQLTAPLPSDALQNLMISADLKSVTLQGPGVTEAVLAPFAGVETLESIYLHLNSPLPPTAVQRLKTLPHLTHLALQGPGVSDEFVASLTQLASLQRLYIANAPVSDAGVAPFLEVAAPPRIDLQETGVTERMSSLLWSARNPRQPSPP